MAAREQTSLRNTMISNYFRSGEYTDITVECNSKQWKVHKVIICGQSQFFKNACKKNFTEGESGVINLPDDNPEAVQALLEYMYQFEYRTAKDNCLARLESHALAYAIGDKYGVEGLQVHAASRFTNTLKGSDFEPGFADLIKTVYTTTPSTKRTLRNAVVKWTQTNLKDLITPKSEVTDLIGELGEFAKDLVEMIAGTCVIADPDENPNATDLVQIDCAHCNRRFRFNPSLAYFSWGGSLYACPSCKKNCTITTEWKRWISKDGAYNRQCERCRIVVYHLLPEDDDNEDLICPSCQGNLK